MARRFTSIFRRSTRRSGGCGRNLPAGNDAYRLLRRALDSCDLYDRRPRNAGPGAGAAVCLSAPAGDWHSCSIMLADYSAEYLIRQIDGGRRRGADFRFLGGCARRAFFRGLLHCAGAADRGQVRAAYPTVPIIGFPQAAPDSSTTATGRQTGVTALGFDWTVPLEQASACRREGPFRAIWTLWAGRRRQGAGRRRGWHSGDAGRRSAGVQSRPWHYAGNADRHVEAMLARVRSAQAMNEHRHQDERASAGIGLPWRSQLSPLVRPCFWSPATASIPGQRRSMSSR